MYKKKIELLLLCILQAYKPYSSPALRLKKKPRVSLRDISGLMDRGLYTYAAGSLEPHLTVYFSTWAGLDDSLPSQRGGGYQLRGIDVRLSYWLPGRP